MAKRRQNGVTVLAPAKLNLTLGVAGIAPNGYHLLDMLMQAVSLYETVEVRKSRTLSLKLPDSTVPANDSNTAIKAALAFFEETGLLAGAAITVHKKIPVRAGMAGGSADAAAVLVGLNELYGAGLTKKQLCDIGVKIGADVPFSIIGGTARVTGIGDILTPCAPCPRCFITVCMPKCGISTPKAFARYDEIGTDISVDTQAAVYAAQRGDLHGMCAQMKNALQFSSESRANAPICGILTKNGALAALMTGSGAAVFGVFETEEKARAAQRELLQKYPQAWVVMPVNHGTHVVNF